MAEDKVETDGSAARGTAGAVPPHGLGKNPDREKGSEWGRRETTYIRSTIIAIALPPPRHRVARPRFTLRSFIA